MNPSKYLLPETTQGTFDVHTAQKLHEILGITEDELKPYGNPPSELTTTFTDGDGHIYRGTLYLVEEKQADA